jgi:hypothetical protein
MTRHLSPDDHLAALDGTLAGERLAHVSGCATCREAIDHTRQIIEALRADDVPEPSPLFWDHFSARVRAASDAAPVAPSPRVGWQVWVTVASAGVACAIVMFLRLGPGAPGQSIPDASRAVEVGVPSNGVATADTEPLAVVLQMASDLSPDDLNGVMSAAGDETPLVDDLNPAERAAFVRLLHAEMEKLQ